MSEYNPAREAAGMSAQLKATGVNYGIQATKRPDDEFPANTRFSPFPEPVRRPAEPEVGTVLGFVKQYSEGGPAYSFVAVRAVNGAKFGRGWYLSGPRNAAQPLDWDSLLDFVGGPDDWARVGVCMAWTPLVGS